MEGTYAIESFPFVSQSFKVCDFFKEYTKYLSDTIYSKQGLATKTDDLEKIACLMGIELDECKELEQLCRYITTISLISIFYLYYHVSSVCLC